MAGLSIARRCRVVVDNDWAGDPDGLVALAHHLLSPGHRVEAVTTSLLSPMFGPPEGGTARGARLAEELITLVGGAFGSSDDEPGTGSSSLRPPVHAGADHAGDQTATPAARAIVEAARRDDPLPLVVVCGGPLTNVSAALRLDPGIATRFTLSWVGGSLDGGPEYNQDTDGGAAAHVLSVPGLAVRQYPVQSYLLLAWSVVQLEETLAGCGALGAWLWDRFLGLLPPGVEVDAVWPMGDSGPLIGTALSPESSTWREVDGRQVCIRADDRLLFEDMAALFRRHARLSATAPSSDPVV